MNDKIKNHEIIEYIISEESKGLRVDQAIAREKTSNSQEV